MKRHLQRLAVGIALGLSLLTTLSILATSAAEARTCYACAPAPRGAAMPPSSSPNIQVAPNGGNYVSVSGYAFAPNETVEVNAAVSGGGSYYFYPTTSSGGAFFVNAYVGQCTGSAKSVTVNAVGYSQDRANPVTITVPAC